MKRVFNILILLLFLSIPLVAQTTSTGTVSSKKYLDVVTKYEAAINNLDDTTKKLESTTALLEEANKKLKESDANYNKLFLDYSVIDGEYKALVTKYDKDTTDLATKLANRTKDDQAEIDGLRKDIKDLISKMRIQTLGVNLGIGWNISGACLTYGLIVEYKGLDPFNIFLGAHYSANNQFAIEAGVGINF